MLADMVEDGHSRARALSRAEKAGSLRNVSNSAEAMAARMCVLST